MSGNEENSAEDEVDADRANEEETAEEEPGADGESSNTADEAADAETFAGDTSVGNVAADAETRDAEISAETRDTGGSAGVGDFLFFAE